MSRAEEITSEVRRLVLTCRAMEAQLQQSIPKKTHQEVVSKMQATIDGLNAENERIKGEYQKTAAMNETINSLANLVKSQSEMVASLNSSVTNQIQVIEGQKTAVDTLGSRLSQTTVPVSLYDQAQSKVQELTEKMLSMVERSDYATLQKKCDDLAETLKSMVPREDYITLQSQFANFVPRESFEALQKTLSQYVPRDQLVNSETRVHELEARLENYVPRSDYEELTARIALLAKEASALSVEIVPAVEPPAQIEQIQETITTSNSQAEASPATDSITPVVESVVAEQTTQSPSIPDVSGQSVQESVAEIAPSPVTETVPEVVEQVSQATPVETIPEAVAAETAPEPPSVEALVEIPVANEIPHVETPASIIEAAPVPTIPATESTTPEIVHDAPNEIHAEAATPVEVTQESPVRNPEITEIQTQLSEIKSSQDTGATTVEMKTVDPSMGFVFANTNFCAKSGLEFLQDLEQTPIETIQNHMMGGDFERWFKEALADDACAESLRSIRENNIAGEDLRSKIVAVIAPRYKF